MAKKLFLLHVGPEAVDPAAMSEGLALGRIAVPDVAAETLAHAGLEIRRTHKAAGLKRKQVEGAWARTCRRAHRTRSDCFVSMPDFFAATPEQAALALDGLAGFRVVLVITSGPHTDQSLDASGLQEYVRRTFDPAKPVAINVIDFGADPDRATWEAVAEATGGGYQNLSTSTSPELATAITTFLG